VPARASAVGATDEQPPHSIQRLARFHAGQDSGALPAFLILRIAVVDTGITLGCCLAGWPSEGAGRRPDEHAVDAVDRGDLSSWSASLGLDLHNTRSPRARASRSPSPGEARRAGRAGDATHAAGVARIRDCGLGSSASARTDEQDCANIE